MKLLVRQLPSAYCYCLLLNVFSAPCFQTPFSLFLPHRFFLDFPIYLKSVYIHSDTISKLCVGKRGRVEEFSVAPLRNKRVKTLCGCRERRVNLQTKEKYKLRLTTKAYKLSYNYINYTRNLSTF
jgi:hypothetical protein